MLGFSVLGGEGGQKKFLGCGLLGGSVPTLALCLSFLTGIFSETMKIEKEIPVFKKGDKLHRNNYRQMLYILYIKFIPV